MRVGFIGLGAMGIHMARNLHQAGLLTAIWNRTREKAATLAAETGCSVAPDIGTLGAQCDVAVLCVSADADVLEVVEQLAPRMAPGSVVIDCSTVSAETARKAAVILSQHRIDFLDCPVTGGIEGARQATLAILVGGDAGALERARPVLAAMGKTITHFGPAGSGQATKAVNQIMCAGIVEAIAEAMAFAKAEGLPLEKVIEALSTGAGSSWYFVHRAPNMARNSYPAGFRVQLHDKDLRICRDMAAKHGVQLPVVEMTLVHYRRLIEQGFGDEDISSLFRLKTAMFDAGQA